MKVCQPLLLLVGLFFGGLSLQAQDIHFSQFYLSPLNLNPAMTGVMNCNVRLVANYRNQWASVMGANSFRTYSASYDQRIPVGRYDYWGVGATFWGDVAGDADFGTTTGKLSASYSKRMGGDRRSSHYLVVGAEGGVAQRNVDFIKLRWGSQFNPATSGFDETLASGETAFDRTNFMFADIAAGLLWFSTFDENNNFYIGGAFHHLNTANQSFRTDISENLYSRYTIHAGGEFAMTNRTSLVPGIIVMSQGPSFTMNTGTSVRWILGRARGEYQAFQLGLWTRISNQIEQGVLVDAAILSTRFDYNSFSLGFSYDINISEFNVATGGNGGFEFALAYKFCSPERRNVYCPNF